MKYGLFYYNLLILCILSACNAGSKEGRISPEAGIVVAADSMRIDDDLNELYFSARLETTEKSDSGEYYLETAWGYNIAQTTIRYPEGLEDVKPAIRRDTGYSYIVGFFAKGDTVFHDYYSVAAMRGTIQMKYIKTYFFQ